MHPPDSQNCSRQDHCYCCYAPSHGNASAAPHQSWTHPWAGHPCQERSGPETSDRGVQMRLKSGSGQTGRRVARAGRMLERAVV